jgi:ATP-dependent helicase/nuclease subunit B
MQAHADAMLAALDPFPDIQALWAQRIARVIPAYLEAEKSWADGLATRLPERAGALDLDLAGEACRLTGRADRIDLYEDGTAAIIDFKTGHVPSLKQMKTFAPQLPLSVALLRAGAFRDVEAQPARAVRYVQTGGNREPVKRDRA